MAESITFGTPTRFGNMCAQMRNFLDQTGDYIWRQSKQVKCCKFRPQRPFDGGLAYDFFRFVKGPHKVQKTESPKP